LEKTANLSTPPRQSQLWVAFHSQGTKGVAFQSQETKGVALQSQGTRGVCYAREERNKDINLISEFKGLFFSNPLLSISLAVSLFSMAGIPPLIGFFSKQLVLYSALQNGYYFISVLAIIVSVISCSYYLQIIKIIFTPSPAEGSPIPHGNALSFPSLDAKEGVRRGEW
jgi:NADH:ubiquinone oxidoreductase subunit 2 (subunit N)